MPRKSHLVSLCLHIFFIALALLFAVKTRPMDPREREVSRLFDPPPLRRRVELVGRSVGGGQRADTPATQGAPPRAARVFQPPLLQQANLHPALVLPASIDAPPDLTANAQTMGVPNGVGGPFSGGRGGPHGLGDGTGDKVGDGDDVYTIGRGGASAPVALHTVEPEYSEEARKVRLSGSVQVSAEIDANGHPTRLRIVRSLGMGLDERAMAAVAQWLFRPGMRNGKPVAVRATFDISFRLL